MCCFVFSVLVHEETLFAEFIHECNCTIIVHVLGLVDVCICTV